MKKLKRIIRKVSKVYLHCSASDNPKHDDVSVIKKWHLERGFNDVGYHYFIKADGTIQTGRWIEQIPAAQEGHNQGSIAICCHGLSKFTDEQRKSLKALCDEINELYQGNISFHGHCEVSTKSCPVYPYKEWLNLNANGFMEK